MSDQSISPQRRLRGKQHPNYGKPRPWETRVKISLSKLGHPVSAQTREKLSKYRGWKHSAETRAAIGLASSLRQHRALSRRKIAEANYGSKSHFAKLTEAQAQAILDSSAAIETLARRHRVSKSTVKRIKSRQTWRHLTRRSHGSLE